MIELVALTGLLVAGIAVAAVLGLVFLALKIVLWTVLLPFRILFTLFFKVLMIPVYLTMGAVGLVAGAAVLPILLLVGVGVIVIGLLAALVALIIPAIPFVLLGLAIWAVMRRRPAVA